MATPTSWDVRLTKLAERDLERLRRRQRKIWRVAVELITELEDAPWLGDDCHPPLDDVRRVHFWNDNYRLVWVIVEELSEVHVLAVARKTPDLYDRVAGRLEEFWDD